MKRLSTLRARFALWTAGLLLVALSAFGLYVYGNMARGLAAAVDDTLTLTASQISSDLDIVNGQLILADRLAEDPELNTLRERGFTVRILTPRGQILQAFGPHAALLTLPANLSLTPAFSTLAGTASDDAVRLYTRPVSDNDQVVAIVQVAQSLAGLQTTLQQLLNTMLVGVPALVLLSGLGGYVLVARALAPVDRITRTAHGIAEGSDSLSARLNLPPTDDEVGRLAETFDAMLARLDGSFRRERQFTTDASHELRTPLTAMHAILDVIREKRRTPEEYEQALADLADETNRLRALTDSLLRLARGEPHGHALAEAVDLTTLLSDVAASLRPLAEAKGLTLTCALAEDLTLVGDSDDLIRLFMNLLDNAIKFTERGGITLAANHSRTRGLTITIEDSGIGIPAEHLDHIFDRFYRADKSRAIPGAGLGLSMASDIARAHGGRIDVCSTPSQGTQMTISLPLPAQSPPTGPKH